jgi:dipeptidyl aminopeptidase/acylaminoacyl peptidase
MATKKITHLIHLLFLFPLCLSAQITDDLLKATNEKYSKLFTSDMFVVSPHNKRGIVTDKNQYDIDRAFVLDLETGKKEPVVSAISYNFLNDDVLVCQLMDKTVLKDLKKSVTREVLGNFSYTFYEGTGKFSLYDRQQKLLLFYDASLILLNSLKEVEMVSPVKNTGAPIFVIGNKLHKMDMKTMKLTEWNQENKMVFGASLESDVIGVEKRGGLFYLNRYSDKGVKSEALSLPDNFELINFNSIIIRNNRYLIVPLRKRTGSPTAAAGKILYTNRNSNFARPTDQMGVYDLELNEWKRVPEQSDLFAIQYMVDDQSTLISYDPSLDRTDSLGNGRYQVTLEMDYGNRKLKLDSPYVKNSSFYYDGKSAKMIYFKDQCWWVQDLKEGAVSKIPFADPANFLTSKYSGLSDEPSGKVYPTNRYATYIITDEYDLFLFDSVTNAVKRLTFGRESNTAYSIFDNKFKKFRNSSNWDMYRNDEIDLNQKYIIITQNTRNYDSGVGEFDFKKLKFKELLTLEDAIRNVFIDKGSVIITSNSYSKPLSVTSVKGKKTALIYQSSGKDEGTVDPLKMEMIHYEINGKVYNAALLYPLNFKQGKKYPVIFDVYERKSRDVLTFDTPHLYEMQGFNALHYVYNGYFVLLPDFDYVPTKVVKSVSASVDALVEKLKRNPMIDIEKMAVTGSSFGGYETTFLMAQGKWFATGFAGVSIVDLPSSAMSVYKDFKIPNYYREEKQQVRMVSNLFKDYQGYLDNSPLYHLPKMTKPILMWLGQNDTNVNPDQSRAFFIGLKRLGKKGILIEYPKEGHNVQNKDNQYDLNLKGWQWMDYHLKDNQPAEWIKPMLE